MQTTNKNANVSTMKTITKQTAPTTIASRALTSIEAIAVAGVTKKEKLDGFKKGLADGAVKTGSVTLRVDYTVTKGEATDAAPTSNLLSLPVLAKALRLSGIQRQNFYAVLKQVALAAMAEDEKVGDQMETEDQQVIVEIENLKSEVIKDLPKKPVSGSVRVATKVTVYDTDEESLMPNA